MIYFHMTYFAIALLPEAKPLITALKLSLVKQSPFNIYANDNYTLIIMGMGSSKALMATTHLLTLYPPKANDILINFGLAGATKEFDIGEMVMAFSLCNQITEKTFYPDMRLVHPFKEVALTTASMVQTGEPEGISCVDLEAFFVYDAALLFLSSAQVLTFKLISDNFSQNIPSKEQVTSWITPHVQTLLDLLSNHQSKLPHKLTFSLPLKNEIDKTTEVLKLTVTQQNQLSDAIKGYILINDKEPLLPKHLPEMATHKKEQKDAFNKLINLLSR